MRKGVHTWLTNSSDFKYNYDVQSCDINGRIAAMVSGGIDSMVMLDLLKGSGADFFVVHVNHGIRAEASNDCEFVQKYCSDHGIEFIQYIFDIPSMAKKSKRSIETEARLARRKVADELLNSGKAQKIALAHHADDNAETILMHIFRGSGLDGLKGISESDKIIRPLLNYTREDIEKYAQAHDIRYVVDKTNFDSDYTRNFIRLNVLPLIKTRYPGVVKALNRLASNAAMTLEALDEVLDLSLIEESDDCITLSLKAFESAFAVRYIILAAKKLMPVDITGAQIENVMKLKNAQTGKRAELANGLKAIKEYDRIVFYFEKEDNRDQCVPFAEGIIEFEDKKIHVKSIEPIVERGKTIIAAPVPSGCVFRHRQEGDFFVPYGNKRKTLKKYFIDKKIPSRQRDKLICLCNGNEVLAVIGVEISDKCKIGPKTQSAYLIGEEAI